MSERMLMIALLATATFAEACGSSHDASGTGGTSGVGGMGGIGGTSSMAGTSGGGAGGAAMFPDCVSDVSQLPAGPAGAMQLCSPSGFPFAQEVFVHSNVCNGMCPIAAPAGTTIRLEQPQTGTLCLSGSTPADATALTLGYIVVAANTLTPTHQDVVSRFDASAKGITQVRFTIDALPPGGVSVGATSVHSNVCDQNNCFSGGSLPSPITTPGTTTVAFTDFTSNPPSTLDARSLGTIEFNAGPGALDFCVHDFQFLDAAGNVVSQ
jgi:hypothetical protein